MLNWKLSDLIDLEFFIERDKKILQDGGIEVLKQRDRQIYLTEIKPKLPSDKSQNPKYLLLLWVKALQRQLQDKKLISPGKAWEAFDRLVSIIFIVIGFISGFSYVFSFLLYTGKHPINVFYFLSCVVFVPWIFFFLSIILRSCNLIKDVGSWSSYLLLRIFSKYLGQFQNKIYKLANQKSVLDIHILIKQILTKTQKYKKIFSNYTLFKLQFLAIAFGIGSLSAFLIKICFFDLAFGWQTTLDVDPYFIEKIVKVFAWPWSWFLPADISYPDVKEIEGSKIILKNGIKFLKSNDLSSWWPFLAMSIATYNIFLRFIVLLIAKWNFNRQIKKIDFSSPIYQQIISRMLTPTVKRDVLEKKDINSENIGIKELNLDVKDIAEQALAPLASLVLVPEEISSIISTTMLNYSLKQFGFNKFKIYPFEYPLINLQGNIDLNIEKILKSTDKLSLVILQEAWQPPLQELISFLNMLKKLYPDLLIIIGLIGMPSPNGNISPPKKEEVEIWTKTIKGLVHPDLMVEELVI